MSETAVVVDVNWPIVAGFVGYLVILVVIAAYAGYARAGSMTDYFLGGRAMRYVVVALSSVTSARSGWLVLGVTGMAFVNGAAAVWAVVGYTVMELFLFLFVAPRIRRITGRMGDLTLPDFFVSRLRGGNVLRGIVVTVIVLFMIAYVASNFQAGGTAFAGTFNIDPEWGLLITAAIVVLYTMVGGYVAVALSDALQGLFMLFGLVVLPTVVVASLGWGPMFDTLQALNPALLDPLAVGAGMVIAWIGIGLGSPGQPHVVVRYMSVDDPKNLRPAALLATFWNVLMGWGAVYLGMAGRAIYETEDALPGQDPEALFPFMAGEYLPAIVAGILVAAVFAAIMSTADSQLLVGASGIVRDIYQRIIAGGRDIPSRSAVWISRGVVLAMSLAAIGLLYVPGAADAVFWLVLFAWGGLGAAFGPPLLFTVFWRGTTAAGAGAGVVTGALVTIVWYYTLSDYLFEGLPGFAASALAVWLVSLATARSRPADVEEQMRVMRGQDGPVTDSPEETASR
ncbi:sodium/proline symporter [Lipingzhangella sp. LS1_29]|uniref:Sodium/proline symporter n=1 Tax=Lipingzhangella rawalii TaxID=2055835 RepID=A0ABU2H2E6_9ACTN|nr:sodium/proline symporter [Lipingzhangella rawalii]MDS1268804.1 sodium/proline symporter [Lipingzhangella rawalii]